jgi:predicted dinucleotide-binding enzyme
MTGWALRLSDTGAGGDLTDPRTSAIEIAQEFLAKAPSKAFHHMGYHDLEDVTRPVGTPGRRALAIADDNPADLDTVAHLVDAPGFAR